MPKISSLPASATPLVGSELVPIVKGGATDNVPVTSLIARPLSVQVPTTGFSITVAAGNTVLNPAGTLATGTITMPAAPVANQEVKVSSTKAITALSVLANAGQSIVSPPTFMPAGWSFTMVYNSGDTTWYPC